MLLIKSVESVTYKGFSQGLQTTLLNHLVHGYSTPTPWQAQVIPLVLSRKDILALLERDSEDTSAFTIPLIQVPCHSIICSHYWRTKDLVLHLYILFQCAALLACAR